MGLTDVSMDVNGYVMGTLEKNVSHDVPVIGLIAHMDTSPDYSGKDVKHKFIENYDGKDIELNEEVIMKVEDFPTLKNCIGQTIITTDDTTLLDAVNKAGITEILAAVEFLIENPEIPRGTIKVGFTPDEEIGAVLICLMLRSSVQIFLK
jgi:tripeptide aminopeptidase